MSTTPTDPEILYFGCLDEPGHYLHSKRQSRMHCDATPWGYDIDGKILEGSKSYREGIPVRAERDGWTAVDFWDNSVDSRPGSHSCFLCAATLTTDELLVLARAQWPEVFARRRFPVLTVLQP